MRISEWSSDVCSSDLTISATGAHGASPHYHSTPESNAELKPGDLYLVDSGGQYEDGTTDVTRVLPVGEPTHEMKDRFTRVLKGNIALDTALFPRGTNGGQLDGFARRPLWEAGLDFAPGTGPGEIGRAHVLPPVTNAHPVCRL